MSIHKTALLPLLLLVAVILNAGAFTNAEEAGPVSPQASARVVIARVNGQPIYEDQLAPLVNAQLRKFRKFGARESNERFIKRLREKALDNLVQTELLYQAGRKSIQIPNLEERIHKKMAEMMTFHTSGLKNLTDEDLRESISRQIFVNEYLVKSGLSDPEIPEAQIREYYEKNKQSFATKESATVRHILLKVAEDVSPQEDEEAVRQIGEARRRILKGEPFGEVAQKYSQCNTASAGGELGRIQRGYMPPEFEAVTFSIEVGKVSDIIRTKFGYHILQVTERTPDGFVPPYEQLKDFIAKFLKGEESRKKKEAHLRFLREKAEIVSFLK